MKNTNEALFAHIREAYKQHTGLSQIDYDGREWDHFNAGFGAGMDFAPAAGATPSIETRAVHLTQRQMEIICDGLKLVLADCDSGITHATAERLLSALGDPEYSEHVCTATAPASEAGQARGLGWKVRERRDPDGTLLDCFIEAPPEGHMPYGLEVLGDDYNGFGDVERKLEHCQMIVSWANREPTTHPAAMDEAAERARFVLTDSKGRFYHFWDKDLYGEPQFGDRYNAKEMTAQGCSSARRMLEQAGYKVERVAALAAPAAIAPQAADLPALLAEALGVVEGMPSTYGVELAARIRATLAHGQPQGEDTARIAVLEEVAALVTNYMGVPRDLMGAPTTAMKQRAAQGEHLAAKIRALAVKQTGKKGA